MDFIDPKRLWIVIASLACLLEIRTGYFKGMWAHLRSFSPRPDRLLLILLPLLTLLLLWADLLLLTQIQAIDGELAKKAIAWGGRVGKHLWKGLIVMYLLAYLMRQEKWQRLFFGAFLGGATTGLTAVALKFTFLRARPDLELGPYSFFHLEGLLQDSGVYQSFPSGDVAIVAGAAGYFFYALRNRLFKGLVCLVPLSTAFSRVILNDHWPSDTIFSIGISFIAARFWWDFKKIRL